MYYQQFLVKSYTFWYTFELSQKRLVVPKLGNWVCREKAVYCGLSSVLQHHPD